MAHQAGIAPRPGVMNAIAGQIQKIVRDPGFTAKMADIGSQAIGDTPAEFRKTIQFELARWSKLIAEAKIKAD